MNGKPFLDWQTIFPGGTYIYESTEELSYNVQRFQLFRCNSINIISTDHRRKSSEIFEGTIKSYRFPFFCIFLYFNTKHDKILGSKLPQASPISTYYTDLKLSAITYKIILQTSKSFQNIVYMYCAIYGHFTFSIYISLSRFWYIFEFLKLSSIFDEISCKHK